uniref:Uncharacterized protein n=1 Tax=Pararge aegeria TaxID=116150 RepID=S4PLN5_9NEOP
MSITDSCICQFLKIFKRKTSLNKKVTANLHLLDRHIKKKNRGLVFAYQALYYRQSKMGIIVLESQIQTL